MKKKPFAAALATVLLAAPLAARAVPLEITLQGNLLKDAFSSSIFGITDASVPFQISFVVDDAAAATVPAGTPIVTSPSAAFAVDAHRFGAGALSQLAATIGNTSFAAGDLEHRTLGDTGLSYDVVLLGSLTTNGVSAALLGFTNASGTVELGGIQCLITCGVLNVGFAESFLEGSAADLTGLQVFSRQLAVDPVGVPEPSVPALLGLGVLALVMSRRRQAA